VSESFTSGDGAAIEARGLSKVYHDRRRGEVHAAREVEFTCAYGEIFGLLGPNGAGKTTTLRMLSTVLRPTSGEARVHGHSVTADPLAVRRSIGYLSGSTGLYGRLTPRELLVYFGRLYGLEEGGLERRAAEVLESLDATSFADTRCDKLSTGMKQKVSIARAILHDPPVLILDEPTTGLDILAAGAMVDFIQQARERGKAVLFSTHILSEAEKLCDRIGIIHEGTIRAVGSLEELRGRTGRTYLEDVFRTLVAADPAS
jgi:sodium transport system ATP-binding protein